MTSLVVFLGVGEGHLGWGEWAVGEVDVEERIPITHSGKSHPSYKYCRRIFFHGVIIPRNHIINLIRG